MSLSDLKPRRRRRRRSSSRSRTISSDSSTGPGPGSHHQVLLCHASSFITTTTTTTTDKTQQQRRQQQQQQQQPPKHSGGGGGGGKDGRRRRRKRQHRVLASHSHNNNGNCFLPRFWCRYCFCFCFFRLPRRLLPLHMLLLLPVAFLLLLSGSPAAAITLPVAMPPSHPKHFLTAVGQEVGASTSLVEAVTSNRVPLDLLQSSGAEEVREDEVMYHLYKNGRLGADYSRKASTVFMVQLFNDLLKGLAPASRRGGSSSSSSPSSRSSSSSSKGGGGGGGQDTQTAEEEGEEVSFTDTIRSFSAEVKYSKKKRATIKFVVPFLPPNERLRSAEIRFLRNPSARKRKKTRRQKLRIDILRGGKRVEKVVLRDRPVVQQGYHVFDVTRVLDSWINTYHGNISLKIRIPRKLEKNILLSDASLKSTSLIALYLEDREFLKNMYESYTTEEQSATGSSDSDASGKKSDATPRDADKKSGGGRKSRGKRDTNAKSKTKRRRHRNRKTKGKRWYRAPKHEKCQMYDFEVDFDFIGWGQWIIHPKHFNARFCHGECPSPVDTKYKPTNHAMLQTLMRQKRPRLAPPTCCVPIRLKPLSMLYFEYDEIVVRHHENMIADECGCR